MLLVDATAVAWGCFSIVAIYLFQIRGRRRRRLPLLLARGCAGGKLLFFCRPRFKFRPVPEEAQTFPPLFDGMKKKKERETWPSERTLAECRDQEGSKCLLLHSGVGGGRRDN